VEGEEGVAELIDVPGPEQEWGPASSVQGRGRNPAWQPSMFEVAGERLWPLALLAVDLEAVARRLRLVVEESWDGLGRLRVAFFVLDGTDYAVTCHEGDPSGTCVWVKRAGPVDPAERVSALLGVLGLGAEAVAFAAWGRDTPWSPGAPPSWRQRPRIAVPSHQEFWESFKTRPGMYVGPVRYSTVTAYLDGYDHAAGGRLLAGFQPWLARRLQTGGNLVWPALALRVLLPEGRAPEPWPDADQQRAVEGLFELLDDFYEQIAVAEHAPAKHE
jgi:hypothetical protein